MKNIMVNIPKYESFVRGDSIWLSLSSKDRARVGSGETWYILREDVDHYSKRYKKRVLIKAGYISDGATGAMDIVSLSWWVHDKVCEDKVWSDGTVCTRWQGSNVLADILRSEGRYIRDGWWKYATMLPWLVEKAKQKLFER